MSFDTTFPHQSYGQDLLRPNQQPNQQQQQQQQQQLQQPNQQFQQQQQQQDPSSNGNNELDFNFSGLSLGNPQQGQQGTRSGYNLPNLPGRRRGACKFFNSQVSLHFLPIDLFLDLFLVQKLIDDLCYYRKDSVLLMI
jgi:hypothetical protein